MGEGEGEGATMRVQVKATSKPYTTAYQWSCSAGQPKRPFRPLNHLSGDDPIPFELIGYPAKLGIDKPYLCHVGLGPSLVLRVRCRDPSFTLRGPVDLPPCIRHLLRSVTTGFWQGAPWRVLARHLWPRAAYHGQLQSAFFDYLALTCSDRPAWG